MLSQEFTQKMKTKLLAEKKEVEMKIIKFSKRLEQVYNPAKDDIAQQAADQELNESLVKTHQDILARINRALGKIESGNYGICEKCGIDISEADLAKEPWAEHCGKCQA